MKPTTESDAQQPVKCRCGVNPIMHTTKVVWRHPPGWCFAADLHIYPKDVAAWNALMSPDQSLLLKVAEAVRDAAGDAIEGAPGDWTESQREEFMDATDSIDLPAIIQPFIEEK